MKNVNEDGEQGAIGARVNGVPATVGQTRI